MGCGTPGVAVLVFPSSCYSRWTLAALAHRQQWLDSLCFACLDCFCFTCLIVFISNREFFSPELFQFFPPSHLRGNRWAALWGGVSARVRLQQFSLWCYLLGGLTEDNFFWVYLQLNSDFFFFKGSIARNEFDWCKIVCVVTETHPGKEMLWICSV